MMAEREGFEPPIPFRVCALSRRVPSATRPSLRATGSIDSTRAFASNASQDRSRTAVAERYCARSSKEVQWREEAATTTADAENVDFLASTFGSKALLLSIF